MQKLFTCTLTAAHSGCIQNTESGFPRLSRPFMCVFQDFSGPFMSIFHAFPWLFNPVDIKQVRFSYNTQYVTQVIIILNNRSNWVWQWTMICNTGHNYTKQQIELSLTVDNDNVCKENMYTGQKCGNHLVYFPWFSVTFQDLGEFHDFPGLENLNFKFHDFPGSVRTLPIPRTSHVSSLVYVCCHTAWSKQHLLSFTSSEYLSTRYYNLTCSFELCMPPPAGPLVMLWPRPLTFGSQKLKYLSLSQNACEIQSSNFKEITLKRPKVHFPAR